MGGRNQRFFSLNQEAAFHWEWNLVRSPGTQTFGISWALSFGQVMCFQSQSEPPGLPQGPVTVQAVQSTWTWLVLKMIQSSIKRPLSVYTNKCMSRAHVEFWNKHPCSPLLFTWNSSSLPRTLIYSFKRSNPYRNLGYVFLQDAHETCLEWGKGW